MRLTYTGKPGTILGSHETDAELEYSQISSVFSFSFCVFAVQLTPAGDSLQDAKLETSNRPEGEVGAPPVAGYWIQPGHFSQVVVHHANVADLAAGRVGHKHEDQQNDENDDCIARK